MSRLLADERELVEVEVQRRVADRVAAREATLVACVALGVAGTGAAVTAAWGAWGWAALELAVAATAAAWAHRCWRRGTADLDEYEEACIRASAWVARQQHVRDLDRRREPVEGSQR